MSQVKVYKLYNSKKGDNASSKKIAGIAVNKSVLKEFKRNDSTIVYMNDGQEFQIMMYNPFSETIGMSISLNGKKISSSYIVLRPGERVWLDRYIDTNNKFMFGTYQVNGKSSSVKEAIKNNGDVMIEVYHERKNIMICDSWNTSITNNDWNQLSSVFPYDGAVYCSCKDCSSLTENTNCAAITNNISDNIADITGCTITTGSANCAADVINGSEAYRSFCGDNKIQTSFCADNAPNTKTIETGRVEKGQHSSQSFNTIYNVDFNSYPSETFKFKIMPLSQKPVFKNDITKKYCTNCGRKLRQEFKFCPACGTKA